jgi:hypothetical protein
VTPKHKSNIYPWKLTKTESIPQAHRATAFHFLISNRLGRLATAAELALALVPSPDGPGRISISSDAITSHYSQLPHFPPGGCPSFFFKIQKPFVPSSATSTFFTRQTSQLQDRLQSLNPDVRRMRHRSSPSLLRRIGSNTWRNEPPERDFRFHTTVRLIPTTKSQTLSIGSTPSHASSPYALIGRRIGVFGFGRHQWKSVPSVVSWSIKHSDSFQRYLMRFVVSAFK